MLIRAFVLISVALPSFAASCEDLLHLNLKNATVTLAESAGPYCVVAVTLQPSSDSDIKVQIILPRESWNGKFEAFGNGGWGGSVDAGSISSRAMRGYATASTDTGHVGGRATFAMGHPEKLIDFGYRSVHEMTVASKAIIAAFYGSAPKHSYFVGCSSGGRQALMEAQRFPGDFDGIVAGAPTNNWTNMMFGRIWVAQATLSDPASYIPPEKYPVIHKAVLEACDAMDGVVDGVLDDPRKCDFDPQVLECKSGDQPNCLTKAQVAAAKRIYSPAKNPRTGEEIFPPMERGSELHWQTLAGGPEPIQLANDHFKYVVFEKPNWDFRTLNFDSDVDKARKRDDGILSAVNPDLSAFFSRGGKLIQYHGWGDRQVMPRNSIHYYESVVKNAGGDGKITGSYRLFMAPGMDHCGGGEGPNDFDIEARIQNWVEKGKAPDAIIARIDKRTRPLCPYPKVAKYKGSGSTDDAANFTCGAP